MIRTAVAPDAPANQHNISIIEVPMQFYVILFPIYVANKLYIHIYVFILLYCFRVGFLPGIGSLGVDHEQIGRQHFSLCIVFESYANITVLSLKST